MNKKRVLVLFFILQMVVTIVFPAPAHAATYAPEVVPFWGVTNLRVVQGVSNRFDAALGLIGQWSKKIQISNANYVALSNEGSGGSFYTLAQSMQNADPNPLFSPEGVTGNPIAKVAWTGQIAYVWANYGSPAEWLWYCNVDDELIDAARTDFLKVLNGESLGGGGGGISSDYLATSFIRSSQYAFTGITVDGVRWTNDVYYMNAHKNESDLRLMPVGVSFGYSKDWFRNLPSGADSYDVVWVASFSGTKQATCYLFPSGSYSWTSDVVTQGDYSGTYYSTLSYSSGCYYFTGYSYSGGSVSTRSVPFVFNGSSVEVEIPYDDVTFTWVAGSNSGTVSGRSCFVGGVTVGGGNDNPNNWPEPTTPDPDPNPTDPTNPTPDPEPPDPPTYNPPGFDPPGLTPDVPVTVVPPDNTTAADYTPWLRAILTALNTIIDDLGEHCDHIRVAMRDYLDGFYEALSDDLQAYYDDLTDYMSDLAKWIVSHLNFDIKQPDVNVNVPGYDDSSVVGWLRRIYYKLGGSGSPRPDPIEDTDGALDWWARFLEWITNALGGLLTDFVGDLGGFLNELIETFPFSIPWDIVAMLTLLDAQRATPDFTVTIPAQEGWWDDITVRIELSAYNDAMATVRGMVLIWWMFVLVMKTDWMMLLFDGANDAIGDFVSRLTGKG